MNIKPYIIPLAVILLMSACSSPEEKKAEQLYKAAEQALQEEQLGYASALLDSIEEQCKTAIEWRKTGHALNYKVQLAIQQDSLDHADTMLVALTTMINETIEAGGFQYEKGEYDELGRFYVKGTDTQNNINRNYIHATTNDYGVVHLISEYRGGSYINHTQLRFVGIDKTEATTVAVPIENEGANYHFKNQGLCHESVTYVNDPALGYMDLHCNDSKLKAFLLYQNGEKSLNVELTEKDRNAIVATYQLGQMLAAQLRFSQQSKIAAGKIQYLQSKIQKEETSK